MSDKIDPALETMGLLPDRYYLVMEPNPTEEGEDASFNVRAYSTVVPKDDMDATYPVAYVILQGLLGALDEQIEDLYSIGFERTSLLALDEALDSEDILPEDLDRIEEIRDNVTFVNFGSKH